MSPTAQPTTHEVFNQAPPLVDYNLFATDRAMRAAVEREGAAWALADLDAFGARMGTAETFALGVSANKFTPVLQNFDRYGYRRDEVEFHPAYHALMALAVGQGLHSAPWADPKPGAQVARAAGVMLFCQAEAGVQCPITMTYGVVPALRHAPDIAKTWLPRIFSRDYDSRFVPAEGKTGALLGMGMTEKQGGSDVRANTTRAEPAGGGEFRLSGHKWFLSAPMCDAFLVLAQAPGGLTCFFLPRFTPDGAPNAIQIQRLKDKLGNRSNASSEVEFTGARAWAVGPEGRGVPIIIEMAAHTRLDCALGSSGLMRQGLAQALNHAAHRSAFQRRLVDQPMMRHVLADLAIESEAATTLGLRLARTFEADAGAGEAHLRRLMTPAAKFLVCKRTPVFMAEAMEVLGGNGYVEESPMPRLYREAPVNSIWEGSGNIMCLDVLRALQRTPEAVDAYFHELAPARGADNRLDRAIAALESDLRAGTMPEASARRLTERLVLAWQGALLIQAGASDVADAFCATRLNSDWSGVFGAFAGEVAAEAIIARAMPA